MKIKANAKKLKLRFNEKKSQWVMSGGEYGDHKIFAPGVYNYRVDAHWRGYMRNNGVSYNGHPEFFPQPLYQ